MAIYFVGIALDLAVNLLITKIQHDRAQKQTQERMKQIQVNFKKHQQQQKQRQNLIKNKIDRQSKKNATMSKQVTKIQQKIKDIKIDQKLCTKFQQAKSNSFKAYLNSYKNTVYTDRIKKQKNEIHIALIGQISAGKSSLLNSLLGLQLQVGIGETTQNLQIVAQSQNKMIKIWDCPGQNQDFSVYQPKDMKFFDSMDIVFLLYPTSLKRCKDLVIALQFIKPERTILVRTKCDLFQKNKRTLAEQLEIDKQLLRKWGVSLPIIATSANNPSKYSQSLKMKECLKTGKFEF